MALPGHAVSRHLTLIVTASPPAHPPPPLPLSSTFVALTSSTTSRLPTSEKASALQVLQGLQAHVTLRYERTLSIRTNIGRQRLEDGRVDARVSRQGGSTRGRCVHVAGREVATCQAPVA